MHTNSVELQQFSTVVLCRPQRQFNSTAVFHTKYASVVIRTRAKRQVLVLEKKKENTVRRQLIVQAST